MTRLDDLTALSERQAHELVLLNDRVREAQDALALGERRVTDIRAELDRRKAEYNEKNRTYNSTAREVQAERRRADLDLQQRRNAAIRSGHPLAYRDGVSYR